MSIDIYVSHPDFQAINKAHETAEAAGYVDRQRMPVGTLSLDAVWVEPIDVTGLFPDQTKPASRRSNGYGGTSRTHRATAFSQPTQQVQQAGIAERVAELDASLEAQLAGCEEGREVTIDEEGIRCVTWFRRTPEQIAKRQQEFWDRAARERPGILLQILREQPYAKGAATAPTAEEVAQAKARLSQP